MSAEPALAGNQPTRRGFAHRLAGVPTPVIFLASIGVALVVLWRSGDVGSVFESLRDADPTLLLLGAILYLAGLFLLCVRWHALVRMIHGESDLPRAGEAFLTSVVINYAAPIGLAVPSRAALTKRALGLSLTETGAVALWEVGADVIVLGIASLIWLATGGWQESDLSASDVPGYAWVLVVLVALICLAGLAALMRAAGLARLRSRARTVLVYPANSPAWAGATIGITVLYWIIQGIVLGIMLNALDVDPEPLLVLGVTSLPILIGMLSPFPGGAGIRETLMGGIARIHGAAVSPTIFAAVAYRLALFASIPVLYLVFRVWLAFGRKPNILLEDE